VTGFGPGGIDCDAVLADVYLYLDDEADPSVRARMKDHLDDCAPCLRRFGVEQDVKSLVARTCGGDRAPAELRARIRVRLTEVTIEASHLEFRPE
jgi:mycothiol system anti-sigma-R factor